MNIIQNPSPNCNPRDGQEIDMLVLHYTGMKSGANALDRMCEAAAEVSAHYMVEEDGRIFQLVDEEMRAWHAGKSYWRGHTNINQRSIGIEIVNPGHEFGYRGFPEVQMQSVVALCKDIVKRRNIPARNVVAHSDVAPTRKQDPGELFDWKRLAGEGVGVFPQDLLFERRHWLNDFSGVSYDFSWRGHPWFGLLWSFLCDLPKKRLSKFQKIALDSLPSDGEIQQNLASYGYDTNDLSKAITAFQRHFHPKRLTGQWDRECESALQALLAAC